MICTQFLKTLKYATVNHDNSMSMKKLNQRKLLGRKLSIANIHVAFLVNS